MNLQELGISLVDDDPNDEELTLMSLRKEGLANKIGIAGDEAKAPGLLFCRGERATQRCKNLPRVLLDLKIPCVRGMKRYKPSRCISVLGRHLCGAHVVES
jgi:two-component system response regulator